VLCAANAKASTIIYTESATVSGGLFSASGSVSFSAALLTLTGTGDTANITNLGGGFFFNPLTVSFSVAGKSGTFTDPFRVFDDKGNLTAGFRDDNLGDLLNTLDPAFVNYDLSTSIGPVTNISTFTSGTPFPTSAGLLVLNLAGDATFTAVVTPLPDALPLFASGLVGLGLLGWRRKRKAAAV
jgi:hypothetical protein